MQSLTDIAAARMLRRDPPRDEPKVKIEVVSRADGHCIAGHRLAPGKNTIEVYASDVDAFRREVDPDDDPKMAAARAHFDGECDILRRKDAGEKIADADLPRGQPSLERSFRAVHRADMQPLKSVRVIDDKRPQDTKRS